MIAAFVPDIGPFLLDQGEVNPIVGNGVIFFSGDEREFNPATLFQKKEQLSLSGQPLAIS
jgi:hypothetical protein